MEPPGFWDGVFVDIETTGTKWTITRHGRAVAVLIGVAEYEALRGAVAHEQGSHRTMDEPR